MSQTIQRNTSLDFMSGGGYMGEVMRAFDWQASSLGRPENWPQPLKTTVRVLLSTGHPMQIWWGKDLIQFYNDAYSYTLGNERHPSSLGQSAQLCWSEVWPEIEPQVTQVLNGQGHTWHENQPFTLTRNGIREDLFWTYSYGPIDDPESETGVGGVLIVCTETTEQVLAEQQMKAAESRWRALFDQAPSFMCILQGPEHIFEYANSNYRKLLGDRELLGRKVADVTSKLNLEDYIELLNDVYTSGKPYAGIGLPLVIDTDEPIYIDFIFQPTFSIAGNVNGIMVQGNDVTQRVIANTTLREEDQRKNEFLAMLAHELRNPLAPIRNVSEILSRSAGDDEKLVGLGQLLSRQVSQLSHLMDDLLDISRISQQRISLNREVLNVSELVSLALESLHSAVELKQHTLRLNESPTPLYVNGDKTRLVQCVSNIVSNAIKYTPPNGLISVNVDATPSVISLTISDNGCGINKGMQSKVFELFTQSKRTLDRSQGGLGIGLNIVQRLVRMHSGSVNVRSEGKNCGSTFTIELPRVSAPSVQKVIAKRAKTIPKRILIVDDNIDSADTMAEILTMYGHKTAVAYTAQSGLALVDSHNPHIVLLDIGLPDMNGYEVAERICSTGTDRLLVAITGYGQAEDVQKAKDAGFDFHFTKPVQLSELTEVFEAKLLALW